MVDDKKTGWLLAINPTAAVLHTHEVSRHCSPKNVASAATSTGRYITDASVTIQFLCNLTLRACSS
jgi:hypothetical protein